jgi:hypothetical protein
MIGLREVSGEKWRRGKGEIELILVRRDDE